MKYCRKCVMPDTRPGIMFNDEGVCLACTGHEQKKQVNYDERYQELVKLCDKYRGMNGDSYDCAVAVSGGKDSFFQVYVMKELMNMNPILFTAEDNFPMTEAGKHNIKMISETFGCDIVSLKPNIRAQKILTRKTFEGYGKPNWIIDRLIYTYPLKMAKLFNTPLLVYGENVSYEYGGDDCIETYSAKDILKNGVATGVEYKDIIDCDISMKELSLATSPSVEDIESLDPIYLSYFIEWNSYKNYVFAKSRGFHDLTGEWDRTMMAENFDQVDSRAYLVHSWLKYPKFGHSSITDYTSRFIRYGMMTREEAIEIMKKKESKLDPKCVQDFCEFTGYSEKEFWDVVDKLYNKEIFTKNEFGEWVLKEPIWKEA